MSRFAKSLSSSQFAEAREFERAGACSISQAVKAFERHDSAKLAEFRAAVERYYAGACETLQQALGN